MKLTLNGKSCDVPVKKVSGFGKYSGLMFKSRKTENLLFEFKGLDSGAIHSLFVFFPFLALWLDSDDKIIDYHLVKPFTLLVKSGKSPKKLVEVPFNEDNTRIFNLVVGKRKDLNIC